MNDLESNNTGTQLSLRTLFYIVTVCGLAIGLYRSLGAIVLVLGAICWAVLAGVVAHQSRHAAAYWRFIASGAILILLVSLPVYSVRVDAGEVGVICLLLGSGGYLAVSSLWNAHWATRVLGTLLSILWSVVFYRVLSIWRVDWGEIYDYWLG